jgi:hypothetical protein
MRNIGSGGCKTLDTTHGPWSAIFVKVGPISFILPACVFAHCNKIGKV